MLFFDAIVACIFIKIFGNECIYAIGITALLAFLRLSIKMDRSMDLFELVVGYLFVEDEEQNI